MTGVSRSFTAIVLAADRTSQDPVARAAGVPCKSLVPVQGRPMILRVLDALRGAEEIDGVVLCGPRQSVLKEVPELTKSLGSGEAQWIPNEASPSQSAYRALQGLAPDVSALVTTADNALLSPRIVDFFCAEARASGCDVVAGVARHDDVFRAYPETRRTVIRLKGGGYCGCNLFGFLTASSRAAAAYWREVEAQRKKALRVVGVLGFGAVLRYLTGQLSLSECLARVSKHLSLRAGAVVLPFPEAAVDVDTVEDWRLVESVLEGRTV